MEFQRHIEKIKQSATYLADLGRSVTANLVSINEEVKVIPPWGRTPNTPDIQTAFDQLPHLPTTNKVLK